VLPPAKRVVAVRTGFVRASCRVANGPKGGVVYFGMGVIALIVLIVLLVILL